MSDNKDSLNSSKSELYIQPDGPNTATHFIGCAIMDDLSEPKGDTELVQCLDGKGKWKTHGQLKGKPGPITTSINNLMFAALDWFEQLEDCNFNIFVVQKNQKNSVFADYLRGFILANSRVTTNTFSGLHDSRADTPSNSEHSVDVSAWPPLIRYGKLNVEKLTTAEAAAINDVFVFGSLDCDKRSKVWNDVLTVADGTIYASANVAISEDAGVTWADTSADPFSTAENIMSVVVVKTSSTVNRIIVALEAPSGSQGKIAYSDDEGVTWTSVNIGGASAGHGAVDSGALFALDMNHIWLASALGYIYFSSDGGVTWTAQESGALHTDNYNSIFFEDSNYGMAVADSDQIAYTTNGGDSWNLVTATGSADNLLTVTSSDGAFWWIGTSGGALYYSNDEGATWTARTGFSGNGTGSIDDIQFANELVGFMIHNSTSPIGTILRTLDGGFSWEPWTYTNAGLNAISVVDENRLFAVGEVNGSTAVILRISQN